MKTGAKTGEDGYALLVVLLVLSVFLIGLSRVAVNWKTAVQRERENRMIDHAREYRTAIKRYFHKYGRYPPDLNALTQKDGFGLRYLRQVWPDPLNTAAGGGDGADGQGDGSWQFLHYGQAVTAEIVDQPPAAAKGGSAQGSVIQGPNLGAAGPAAPSQPFGGGANTAGGANGLSTANGGLAGGLAGAPGSGGAAAAAGPIIGVASRNKRAAIHEFNGFDTPNDWQFVYNFALDPSLRAAGTAVPVSAAGTGTIPASGVGSSTPGIPH